MRGVYFCGVSTLMKLRILLVLLMVCALGGAGQCYAQGYPTINAATSAIAARDTQGTINFLKEALADHELNIWKSTLHFCLGQLYFQRHQLDSAKAALQLAVPSSGLFIHQDIYPQGSPHRVDGRSDAYSEARILLSRIADAEGKRTQASGLLMELDTGRNNYHHECGNDWISYQGRLSEPIVDHHLRWGDTIAAIDRLVRWSIYYEGCARGSAARLRQILLLKYSNTQIQRQVARAISQAYIYNGDPGKHEPAQVFAYTLFGTTILREARKPLAEYKAQLAKNECLKIIAGW